MHTLKLFNKACHVCQATINLARSINSHFFTQSILQLTSFHFYHAWPKTQTALFTKQRRLLYGEQTFEFPSASNPGSSAEKKTIRVDGSKITNSYAHACNVSSTQEEVVLAFGINNAWERQDKEIQVQQNNRIIVSPYAAKRLAAMLGNVWEQYEKKFGVLTETSHTNSNGRAGSA